MQTDNKENQLNKDINRMVRTLNAKTLSKNRRKQIEEDIAYKQKRLQDHMGVKTFIRPMNSVERKAAIDKRKANNYD